MSQISNSLSLGKIAQYKPECKPEAQSSGLERPAKSQIVKQLRQKIRRTETASRNDDGTIVSSGSAAIDAILPAGGYHRGTITEWITDTGSGAEFISLTAARQAALEGGAIVIVDATGQFYPPAAAALGINLGNLIVLRDTSSQSLSGGRGSRRDTPTQDHVSAGASTSQLHADDFLWSIDQSLRCPAVAAVWGHMPEFTDSLIRERWLRRFQLSAESSGCMGLFLHPQQQLGRPSWSEVQWAVKKSSEFRVQGSDSRMRNCRRVEMELVRCRAAAAGQTIVLDINTISGTISESLHHETSQNQKRTAAENSNDPTSSASRDRHSTDSTASPHRSLRPSRALSAAAELADPAAGRRAARA